MSLRQFNPRRNRRRGIAPGANRLLLTTLFATIALQISYPLLDGDALRLVTLITVYCAAAAMLLHALYSYGNRYFFTYLIVTFIFGFLIEEIGVRTSWPFGQYEYSDSLGIKLSHVPLVVPFAWIMMVHPVLVAARRVTSNWAFLYGGLLLMTWDLFLDPQMVSAGRWSWKFDGAHVPFQPEIPLSNAAGWLLSGMAIVGILHLALPRERRKQAASSMAVDIFLAWTWFAGVIGNIFFFHRPAIGLAVGTIFLLAFLPYLFARSVTGE
jgi:putative membrane protein